MKKLFYAVVMMVGFIFVGGVGVHADTIKDTSGNPVDSNHKYIIESVIDNNISRYWYTDYGSPSRWIRLTTDQYSRASFYNFPTASGKLQENSPYKIYAVNGNGYLWYQDNGFFYPKGGVYVSDTKSGSINWTFHLAQDGMSYDFTADDGTVYADIGSSLSLVATHSGSYDFTVKFHRVD